LLTNSLQKLLGGFVGRVLGKEATLESTFQDALPQPGGSLQVGFDLGIKLVENRELHRSKFKNGTLFIRW
jgi:hypothetical protein